MHELEQSRELVSFWFGPLTQGLAAGSRRAQLFRADAAFDRELELRFGELVHLAQAGKLNHWRTRTLSWQALLLLLDQLPRNLFRGSAQAYASDGYALQVAREGVSRGDDRLLELEHRVFSYLPFMHSESLADQDTCVHLLERLQREQAPDSGAYQVLDNYLHHAQAHRQIILQFGRFPHRNGVLGRAETAEEKAWLARDGRRFGQAGPPV